MIEINTKQKNRIKQTSITNSTDINVTIYFMDCEIFAFLRRRALVDGVEGGGVVPVDQGEGRVAVGLGAALGQVPVDVVGAVGSGGGVHRLQNIFAHDQLVDGAPQHTAGVDSVDVVYKADHRPRPGVEQGVGHGQVQDIAAAEELTGLGKDHGALQPAAAVGRRKKVGGDAVVAVHLDDPVGQEVKAVAQVVPEGTLFPQQQDRR